MSLLHSFFPHTLLIFPKLTRERHVVKKEEIKFGSRPFHCIRPSFLGKFTLPPCSSVSLSVREKLLLQDGILSLSEKNPNCLPWPAKVALCDLVLSSLTPSATPLSLAELLQPLCLLVIPGTHHTHPHPRAFAHAIPLQDLAVTPPPQVVLRESFLDYPQ